MSVRRLAAEAVQPASFAFTPENQAWAQSVIAKYPAGRQASAVIPLLWRAQEQHDFWLPKPAIEAVAAMLGMPVIRVLEVATFYTMFNLEPVGKYFIQLCGTTPCRLCGAADIVKVCESRIGAQRHVTADGMFSWLEVECLGSCCNAPMVQINKDYYEDLTAESFNQLLDDLAAGRPTKVGPQNGRRSSEPKDNVKTLTDPSLFDGSVVGAWRQRFAEEEAKAKAAAEAAAAEKAAAAAVADVPKPAKPSDETAAAPATAPTQAPPAAASADKAPEPEPVSDAFKPTLFTEAPTEKDDLELIWGVGPKLAAMLNGMGVYQFRQIAAWTEMNLRWVDQNLGAFKGRAVRDKWIEQAEKLARGERPSGKLVDKPQG